jgi:hypothetical protein
MITAPQQGVFEMSDDILDDVIEMLDDDRDPRTIASIIGCSVERVYSLMESNQESFDD